MATIEKEGGIKYSLLDDIPNELLKHLIIDISQRFLIKTDDLITSLNKKLVSEKNYSLLIPISVFDNEELSSLEAIVKYLKEEIHLKYREIALSLNRDSRTIWSTYKSSIKKRKSRFSIKNSNYAIPVTIFRNRVKGVLEALVVYLKDEKELRFHEIALLLNRNDRTVWTCYSRAKKK